MFSKAVITLAALAVAQVALAQPYCLLTAVNKFEHPADQKTLCCTDASKVKDYLKQLCPSGDQKDAVDAFNTACKDAGYGTCSSSSSSITSASATGSGKASATSAPYPVIKTSTYYDTECSCTKTKVQTSHATAGSTGFATGTAPAATGTGAAATGGRAGASAGGAGGAGSGSGSAATGSPIVPAGPSGTGSSTNPSTSAFKGAATRNVGSVAAGLLAVAAIAMTL